VDETTTHPLRGRYTNYFEIRYTASEFLVDFGEHYPESEPPYRHTRIVASSESAQALCDMLAEALKHQKEEISGADSLESRRSNQTGKERK
jgi:hypothetical protein